MTREPDWLSTQEASKKLGISLRTLYALVNDGGLPCYRVGKNYRLRSDEVDAWPSDQVVRPGELDHLLPGARRQRRRDHEPAERPARPGV